MSFCLFLTFRRPAGRERSSKNTSVGHGFAQRLRDVAGLDRAVVMTPSAAADPFLAADVAPDLVLQLYFPTLPGLEAAATRDGVLASLVADAAADLGDAAVHQQTMLLRPFELAGAPADGTTSAVRCSYLVGYEGATEDIAAWLAHYLAGHIPLMRRLPDLRRLELFTRVDDAGSLALSRENFMQRNRVEFDSPEALDASLASPIRAEMRADYNSLPPFTGPVSHHPMTTVTIDLAAVRAK